MYSLALKKTATAFKRWLVNPILKTAGFDQHFANRLARKSYVQIYVLSLVCIAVPICVGLGLGYAAFITGVRIEFAIVMAFLGGMFCINIFRMLNSGGAFPVGMPKEKIDLWSPAIGSSFSLTLFGALITLPCAMYLFNIYNGIQLKHERGIIANWNDMANDPNASAVAVIGCALAFSAFHWLRFIFITALREYETIRWENERGIIDSAFSDLNSIIQSEFYSQEAPLDEYKHFADAPYNFRPKLFGTESSSVSENAIKFISSTEHVFLTHAKGESSQMGILTENGQSINQADNETSHPDFFNMVAREVFFQANAPIKLQLSEYLHIDLKNIEKRILNSDNEALLLNVFELELSNYELFQKYNLNSVSSKTPINTHSQETLACPSCQKDLTCHSTSRGYLYECTECESTVFSKQQIVEFFNNHFDSTLKNKPYTLYQGPSVLACPHDNTLYEKFSLIAPVPNDFSLLSFNERALNGHNLDVSINVCPTCSGQWISNNHSPYVPDIIQEHASREIDAESRPIGLQYIFQLMTGMPVEVYNPVKKWPSALTFTVIALICMFFWQKTNPELTQKAFLLYPAGLLDNPLKAISSIFMHGNLTHLVGNLLFLWIFSDNIEDKHGKKAFLFIFLATGACGNILHVIGNFSSNIGVLGASGSVYGMMGAYLVLYQRMKVWWVVMFIPLKVSIFLFVIFRVSMDVYGYLYSTENIAWLAHLGGFSSGLVIAYVIKHQLIRKIR